MPYSYPEQSPLSPTDEDQELDSMYQYSPKLLGNPSAAPQPDGYGAKLRKLLLSQARPQPDVSSTAPGQTNAQGGVNGYGSLGVALGLGLGKAMDNAKNSGGSLWNPLNWF